MSKKKEQQAKQQLASLGLDPSLFDDPVVSDEEMNEEEFINSFAPKKMPQIKPVDVSSLLDTNPDDIHVELDEDDLDENSELNKSLMQLMAKEEEDTQKNDSQKQLEQLEQDLLESKRAAVFFRQQGLMQEAKEQLLEIKRLNQAISELREQISPTPVSQVPTMKHAESLPIIQQQEEPSSNLGEMNHNEDVIIPGYSLPPLQPELSLDPKQTFHYDVRTLDLPMSASEQTEPEPEEVSVVLDSETNELLHEETSSTDTQDEGDEEILPNIKITQEDLEAEFMNLGEPETPDIDPLQVKLERCEEEKQLCMQEALHYKSKNLKSEAIAWLRAAKLFEGAITLLQSDTDVDIEVLLEKKPDFTKNVPVPVQPPREIKAATSAPTVIKEPSPEEKQRLAKFVALESKLKEQAERWKEKALNYKAAGELPMAVKYLNERKLMVEDLRKIAEGKNCPGMPLPLFSKESYTHIREIHFRSRIQPEELEVAIVQASNIKPPSGFVTVDSYVSVSCPVAAEGAPQTWKTHKVSNTNSPVFKEIYKFKIDRTKRTFVKAIERKKISFELFHSRWLRGDISLGKCEISVSDIKSKAEIKEELPILTNGKRDTGGRLIVRIRVCYPLLKKQIEEENEDIIVITKHFPVQEYPGDSTTDALTSSLEKPSSPVPLKEEQQSPKPAPLPVGPSQQNTTPSPKNDTPKEPNNTIDDTEEDYNPVECMMSNDVLEWALESVNKEMELCKRNKQAIPEELITKQQQIELKLQLLIVQIQIGKLSVEQYVENVTNKIAEEKQLAKTYLTQKNQIGARYALTRAKIMTTELEGE